MESPRVIKGISAAPGLATGPVFVWRELDLSLPAPYTCEDDLVAWKKICSAIENAKDELLKIRSKVEQAAGREEAAIFDAHLMMMEDMALHDMVRSALKNGINPEAAWHDAVEAFAAMVESIPDPTLGARGMDVRDVGQRVLAHLLGKSLSDNTLGEPSVVIARDLTPSQTAMIDHSMVLAFCTAEGGPTSHTAILSKALGIPAIVALGDSVLGVPSGELILVDANAGELTRQPADDQWIDFEQRRKEVAGQIATDLKAVSDLAITLDGKRVEVFANIGSVADALLAVEQGAEGVGLFRTEILYLNRVVDEK